jgi:hypothetical protein
LKVPTCAKTSFQQVTSIVLQDKDRLHLNQSYPCDATYMGLLALSIAVANETSLYSNTDEKSSNNTLLQYWALATLYFALDGQNWRIDRNWLTGIFPCNDDDIHGWYGISCLEGTMTTSIVDKIQLRSNNLMGSLPTEIGLLTSLRTFQVSDISGTLPTELRMLQNLSELWISETRMSSSNAFLPSEIGQCQSLTKIVLTGSSNVLSGTIPTEIGRLSQLST